MSKLMVLEAFKTFTEKNIANTIKLKKPYDDDYSKFELVNPSVHTGWIPPNGLLPPDLESHIPCIVIGCDNADTDDKESSISIKLSFAVYSPGNHYIVDGEMKYTPDFQGYVDLMNLMERTEQELLRKRFIEKKAVVELPVTLGMYQDPPPYPYWYGFMTFTAKSACTHYTENIYFQYL